MPVVQAARYRHNHSLRPMLYQHTQIGVTVVVTFGLVILVILGFSIADPTSLPIEIGATLLTLLLFALVIFSRLTVKVCADQVEVHFGFGVCRRRFALIEIDAVERVRNPWYYGWGIRLTPEGWMYNVSGFDAVQLQLASGKRFRIGTDEPEPLKSAIDRARRTALA